jgi:uncharacterized protein YbcI
MSKPVNMAQQIAEAASAAEKMRSGLIPKSVTVVQGDGTLVVTLHGALSAAERALAASPAGAAKVQEYHRQLFAADAEALRAEITRITGVEVREAVAEVEPTTGAVVAVFATGTIVQVYLLKCDISAAAWSAVDSGR